nr:MAG TPA: hypothetical protein [Caudoviricetes sp.]
MTRNKFAREIYFHTPLPISTYLNPPMATTIDRHRPDTLYPSHVGNCAIPSIYKPLLLSHCF